MSYKIEVGTLVLAAPRDVRESFECAAWSRTVRVPAGTYPVYAYVSWRDGRLDVQQVAAECAGACTAAFFPSLFGGNRIAGTGVNDHDVGRAMTTHIQLATYGCVREGGAGPRDWSITAPALFVETWDPDWDRGPMWRLSIAPAARVQITQAPRTESERRGYWTAGETLLAMLTTTSAEVASCP